MRGGRILTRHRIVAALGGLALGVLVGGWPGLVAGSVGAVLLGRYLGRLEPAERRRERAAAGLDLPYAADLRGLDRVRLTAAAHAAGTRATAGLLAVLPLAGIGVGYGMGADPLHVLLHTPVGAGCLLAALLLQLAGLGWTARLTRLDRT